MPKNKILRWLLSICAAVLLLLAMAVLVLHIQNWRQRGKAEKLLANLSSSRIGEAEQRTLAKYIDFPQCEQGFCHYVEFHVHEPGFLYKLPIARQWFYYSTRWLGLSNWQITAMHTFNNEKLFSQSVYYDFADRTGQYGRGSAWINYSHKDVELPEMLRLKGTCSDYPGWCRHPPFYWSVLGSGGLYIHLTNEATDQQIKNSYDFNLRCQSKSNGCSGYAEAFPAIWDKVGHSGHQ
jgi:hypothetical protein